MLASISSLKPFISELLMCDLDRFSKIQSQMLTKKGGCEAKNFERNYEHG